MHSSMETLLLIGYRQIISAKQLFHDGDFVIPCAENCVWVTPTGINYWTYINYDIGFLLHLHGHEMYLLAKETMTFCLSFMEWNYFQHLSHVNTYLRIVISTHQHFERNKYFLNIFYRTNVQRKMYYQVEVIFVKVAILIYFFTHYYKRGFLSRLFGSFNDGFESSQNAVS